MESVGATRTALLARRAQIALAEQGRELLQDKREQLVEELRLAAGEVLEGSDALDEAGAAARTALDTAQALDGPTEVASAAMAAAGDVLVDAGIRSIMGVDVPVVEYRPRGRSRVDRGYSLAGTSPRIDATADRFEAVIDLVLQVASGEMRLRRLATELAVTTRRVNALEHHVIPELVADRNRIQRILEEREREDHFRLKRIQLQRGPDRRGWHP